MKVMKKLDHITQFMICLLAFSASSLTNSTSLRECSRDELSASGLGIDAEEAELLKHDFTSRKLSDMLKILPPSVIEDLNVRISI